MTTRPPATAVGGTAPTGSAEGRPADRCHVCVDADWLLMSGEQWEQVAARLQMLPESLERHLHRHDRRDLLARRTR